MLHFYGYSCTLFICQLVWDRFPHIYNSIVHVFLFQDQATDDHRHPHHLTQKTRSFIKRKIPAPHLLSVCIHDPRTGKNIMLLVIFGYRDISWTSHNALLSMRYFVQVDIWVISDKNTLFIRSCPNLAF